MKDNSKPNLLPLGLIIIGSCLLALPGAYGAIFLFAFAAEGASSNPLSLLIPLPAIIGFGLLFGYIWTAVSRRFIGWLWLASFFFNFIVSVLSVLGAFYYVAEARRIDGSEILFILFPIWTIFVAAASVYYYRLSRAATVTSLP
jgi:hypothetical protein